jgi:hypothetical protein
MLKRDWDVFDRESRIPSENYKKILFHGVHILKKYSPLGYIK